VNGLKLKIDDLAVESFPVTDTATASLLTDGPVPAEGTGTKPGYCSFDGPCPTAFTDCPCA
jgi:hypothetical protein